MITSSQSNNDFENLTTLTVPYSLVVSGNGCYVYLVTDEREVSGLERLHRFDKTLPDIGLKRKTGLPVDMLFSVIESIENNTKNAIGVSVKIKNRYQRKFMR